MTLWPQTWAASASHIAAYPRKAGERALVFLEQIFDRIPTSSELEHSEPAQRSRAIARRACAQAAFVSGSLATPGGALAWVTVVPDLLAIWKIQSQMVADIAGAYGQSARLTRQHLVYCVFRHAASQAVRDLVVRIGERVVVREVTAAALRAILKQIGVHLTRSAAQRMAGRLIPFLGAAGVGAYAWYDTRRVAQTAMELFGSSQPPPIPTIEDPEARLELPPPVPGGRQQSPPPA